MPEPDTKWRKLVQGVLLTETSVSVMSNCICIFQTRDWSDKRSGVQFNGHLKFKAWVKAWVKDEVKDAFRKALDREMVKAWVKVWVMAIQNVY